MKLQLPFAFEIAYRVYRGHKLYREIFRSQVEVDIQEVSRDFLEDVLHVIHGNEITPTSASPEGLFRALRWFGQPIRAANIGAFLDPSFRQSAHEWSRDDFPRPQYVRSAGYADRHALDWPNEAGIPRRLRSVDSQRESAMRHAINAYEKQMLVVDGELWVRVPEPVWMLRPVSATKWCIAVELQPTIWNASLSFSIASRDKAEWFAEQLCLDIVERSDDIVWEESFKSTRSDLTALAASTIALAAQPLSVEPDEEIYGEKSLEIVEKALLAAGGRSLFPWTIFPGRFVESISARQLRGRWRFELDLPEHRAFKDAIWSDNPAVKQMARDEISQRHLAHVDQAQIDAEEALKFLV